MTTPTAKAKAAPGKRNAVRIIGGGWRGRRVHFPDSPGLRPTPDRVRETLFNWLQPSIAQTRCLDLFAGSGALGLEALSRGARQVVFVEQAAIAVSALKAALHRLGGDRLDSGRLDGGRLGGGGGAGMRAIVVHTAAARFLSAPGEPFDVVFLDPPFGRGTLAQYVTLLDEGGWVKSGGCVYLESERAAGLPAVPSGWDLIKSKSAGEVGYHLARVNAPVENE